MQRAACAPAIAAPPRRRARRTLWMSMHGRNWIARACCAALAVACTAGARPSLILGRAVAGRGWLARRGRWTGGAVYTSCYCDKPQPVCVHKGRLGGESWAGATALGCLACVSPAQQQQRVPHYNTTYRRSRDGFDLSGRRRSAPPPPAAQHGRPGGGRGRGGVVVGARAGARPAGARAGACAPGAAAWCACALVRVHLCNTRAPLHPPPSHTTHTLPPARRSCACARRSRS